MKVIQGLFTSENTTLLTDKFQMKFCLVCTAAAVVFLLALN